MDSDNGSCLMEEITENTDIDEMVVDAIKVDVIGFGALNVDKLYKVKNIAGVDGESFIKSEDVSPGGSAANTIIGLSKLGCSTSYIGKIADDEDGDLLEYNLILNNVYLNNLIYADKGNSGKVLGFVSDEGDRELYVDPGVNDDIHISEINPLNVNQAKILHYTSFVGDSFKAQVELLDVIVDSVLLSFDPGALYVEKGFEALRPILERTNILLVNEKELKLLFEDDEKLKKTFANLVEEFHNAEDLARILMRRRSKRGAIDFDFPEAKIILNKDGDVVDIKPYERRISNKIIEEFMLVSNETIAEHFFWLNIPFVYRIHETPASEKIETLNKFISTFGYLIKGEMDNVHPKALQSIIKDIHGKTEEKAISTIMLRSLKQARYSPDCVGHFGLAAKYYSHFTSPIRRYPDLQIHRIIKEFLNNKLNSKRQEQLTQIVDYASTQSSERERAAELAERDVHDIYKSRYMADKVGEEYIGIVSSVTSFGLFIELDNTVEGLVRLADMKDDYYIFDEESYTILGERTKKMFKIGDVVKIKVDSVNVDFKEINFELLEKIEDQE